jgi:exonuclease III
MKILTWNCNGAFRKKFEHLSDFDADIHVIQECEDPNQTKDITYKQWAENHLWIGNNKNKGVGIFAGSHIKLEQLDWSDLHNGNKVRSFLPCLVNNDFQLLGIWTHQNNSPNFRYIGQLWKYLQVNKQYFNKILLAGDFNSNTIWDEWDRWWNHSDVVKELKELGIESSYHHYFQEEQGKESRPTFFLHRNLLKPYHIDYVFGSQEFTNSLNELEIGKPEKWLTISDHLPLIVKF